MLRPEIQSHFQSRPLRMKSVKRPTRHTRSNQNFSEIKVVVAKRAKPALPKIRVHNFIQCHNFNSPIDYSAFTQLDCTKSRSHYQEWEIFHGILHYISFHSGNRYNSAEFPIECSRTQPHSNPENILDFKSDDALGLGNGTGQCVVITFRRIYVRPRALVISWDRVPQACALPQCYLFEGWDDQRRRWVVFVERSAVSAGRPAPGIDFNRTDTEKWFAKFRVRHADPFFPPVMHIAIKGLEIHGNVCVTEPCTPLYEPIIASVGV
jgi:hypothetical protein